MKKRKVVETNFSKWWLYILVALGILTIISFGIYAAVSYSAPNPGHTADQVFIQYSSNCYEDLQTAVDNDYLLLSKSSFSGTCKTLPKVYELASQILITYNSKNMTLQEAVNNNIFSGGSISNPTNTIPAGGHYFTDINVDTIQGVMTFQNAIKNNLLAGTYSWVDTGTCTTFTSDQINDICLGAKDVPPRTEIYDCEDNNFNVAPSSSFCSGSAPSPVCLTKIKLTCSSPTPITPEIYG